MPTLLKRLLVLPLLLIASLAYADPQRLQQLQRWAFGALLVGFGARLMF